MTVSTLGMPFSAFSSVSGSATTLPPAIGSISGAIFHAMMSPTSIARAEGNTTNASPSVWPGPK